MNTLEQTKSSPFQLINAKVLVSSDIMLEREKKKDSRVYRCTSRTRNIIKDQLVSKEANFISSLNNKKINAEILKRYCGILWAFQHF